MCERFNALPAAGGILDQDHVLIRKLVLVLNAFREREQVEAKKARAEAKRQQG